MCLAPKKMRTLGGSVSCGTALHAGSSRVRFPMVSLTLSFLGRLSLEKKWVPRIFPVGKAAGTYGWKTYHLHVSIFLNYGTLNFLEPSESEQVCTGIAFYLIKNRGMSVNKSFVWTDCESLTILQHICTLPIMHVRLRQVDSELNHKWFNHLGKRYCVKQCS